MENLKKESLKKEITIDEPIKRVSELTKEDILKIKRYPVTISTFKTKSKRDVYSLELKLHEQLKLSPKGDDRLTVTEFNYLKTLLNSPATQTELNLNVPVRFFTGPTQNGGIYFRIQIILYKGFYKNIWMTSVDYDFSKLLEKSKSMQPIEWIERSEELNDNINFDELF